MRRFPCPFYFIALLNNVISRYDIEITYIDFTDLEAVKNSIRPNTVLLYTEVIANPLTTVINIKEIADIAHNSNALLLVDSTFTTPSLITPLIHVADIVVHNLTKYFSGHSNVTAGSITSSSKKLIDKAYHFHIKYPWPTAQQSWSWVLSFF